MLPLTKCVLWGRTIHQHSQRKRKYFKIQMLPAYIINCDYSEQHCCCPNRKKWKIQWRTVVWGTNNETQPRFTALTPPTAHWSFSQCEHNRTKASCTQARQVGGSQNTPHEYTENVQHNASNFQVAKCDASVEIGVSTHCLFSSCLHNNNKKKKYACSCTSILS